MTHCKLLCFLAETVKILNHSVNTANPQFPILKENMQLLRLNYFNSKLLENNDEVQTFAQNFEILSHY